MCLKREKYYKVAAPQTELDEDHFDIIKNAFTIITDLETVITNQTPKKYREMPEYKNSRLIIFPDDDLKYYWDSIIIFLMIYTITITPYQIAFIDQDNLTLVIFDYIINALFIIDVFFNCFLAYSNTEEESLVVSHYQIIKNYASSWMLLDIISSFPFQLIFQNTGWSAFARLSKVPRLYRLVKILKLVRLIKVVKNRNNLLKSLECLSKLSIGLERLLYLALSFFVTCHLFACLIYFTANLNSDSTNNWVYKYGIQDEPLEVKYLASVYWIVTIFCTVGYGDISAASYIERTIIIFVEFSGVFFYSYTIGTITSLMAEMEKNKSKLDLNLSILQEIASRYKISRSFHEKLKQALEYTQNNLNSEINEILNLLPKKLSTQLNIILNRELINKNKFFENKQIKFIISVLEFLKPLRCKSREVIYKKGEFTEEIFLIQSGEVSLLDYEGGAEMEFERFCEGDFFGDVEVFLSDHREYSAKTVRASELFSLGRDELLSQILSHRQDEQREMIKEATIKREAFLKKKAEALKKNSDTNFSRESKDVVIIKEDTEAKDFTRFLSPVIRRREKSSADKQEYNRLRRTLAPTTRALLEENDESVMNDLRVEVKNLSKELKGIAKVLNIDLSSIK